MTLDKGHRDGVRTGGIGCGLDGVFDWDGGEDGFWGEDEGGRRLSTGRRVCHGEERMESIADDSKETIRDAAFGGWT